MRIIKYIIPRKYNNEKISTFLKDRGYSSKNLTVMRRTEGAIVLNGCKVYMNRLLQDGDDLRISIPEEKKSEKIVPVNLPIEIVYEDEDILVVNKPPFMPTHPSLNNYENTLANALAYYYKKKYPENNFVFRCINRLDRDTSGLTIIAKHMVSASVLHQQVIDDVIKRTYYAIVEEKEGEAIKDEGVIDLPIGRQNDSSITRCVDMENGQRAVTHYKIISRGEGWAFAELHLETGRTHQIRVHMKAIGHPLLGDFLYNPSDNRLKRQALHAGELEFNHPITGEKMRFKAGGYDDMRGILTSIYV